MSGETAARARSWCARRDEKNRRMESVRYWMDGPVLQAERIVDALHLLIQPHDRIVLEGDNQKQAEFLSRSLAKCDPGKLHDLHLIISSISRPEHLTLFELGIAKKVDFAFAGPQSVRLAQLLEDGKVEIGAIHTYVELYSRLLVDLAPTMEAGRRQRDKPVQIPVDEFFAAASDAAVEGPARVQRVIRRA